MADVRVAQAGDGLRLALEPGAAVRIGADVGREHLDRDGAIEAGVAGLVDIAHAAGPDGGEDLVRVVTGVLRCVRVAEAECESDQIADGAQPVRTCRSGRDWQPGYPEKTIVDGLDLPRNVGGIGTVTAALRTSWPQLDEARLRGYVARIGNSAVAKRLGFLMEALGVGDAEALREAVKLAHGYSRLDPTLPAKGTYNRRWGLLVNARVTP